MIHFMRDKKVWLILVSVIILALVSAYAYSVLGKSGQTVSNEPQVQTAVARNGEIILFAAGAGTVVASTEIGVGFQESGILDELLVGVGDQVDEGQVLARLKTNNTEESIASSLASAQLSYLNAKKNLQDIRDSWELDVAQSLLDIEEAETNLLLIQDPALRQAQAYQAVAEAQQALEDAQVAYNRTNLTASQANIDDAYADLIIARSKLERAEDNFEKYASRSLDDVQRAQAQSSLSAAQQAFDTAAANYNAMISTAGDTEKAIAEADLSAAQATLIEAQREYEVIQGGSTPGEMAMAEAVLSAAKAAYEKIKEGPDPEEIAIAEAQLANAAAQLTLAEDEKVYVDLTSPIGATVMSIDANVGEQVSAGAIINLADLEQPLLEVYLDETDLDKVASGYEVEVVFDAFPDSVFTGKIVQVDPSLSKVNNVTVIRAVAALDAESYAKVISLPVGLNASVDVIGGRAENAVLIPVEALRELGQDEYAVFVMVDGEPQLRIVEVGLKDFTSAEILSGLEAGEIVTTGIVDAE